MSEKIRAHVFVSGRVQGVSFRAAARNEAERLGVLGWIRNLPVNQVEIMIEGKEEQVKKMVDWARKGSIWAKVDDMSVEWGDFKGEFDFFEIRF